MKLAPFLALLAVLGMPTVGAAHDVDVTSVARVFLEEVGEGRYLLSVVDAQAPPIIDRRGAVSYTHLRAHET